MNLKMPFGYQKISKIEEEMPFTGLGIKYVASGEETYYANNKKFKFKCSLMPSIKY